MTEIADRVAAEAKFFNRRVWCRECGSTRTVDNGLRNGWPKCCTFTMTIDPPARQRSTDKL